MRDVRIVPAKEPKEGSKTRSFRATLLAHVEADALWEGGNAGNVARPVWAMFAGSETELRPFVANLLGGHKGETATGNDYHRGLQDPFEFLRSAGIRATWQRETEGSIVTLYLPDLFELDPGMVDPEGAAFVAMPDAVWIAAQAIDVAPIVNHMALFEPIADVDVAALVPLAFLFASYLDRRTRFPLYADGRFYMQLLLASLAQGLASWPGRGYDRLFGVHSQFGLKVHGLDDVHLPPPVAFRATHDAIGALLDEQVSIFFDAISNEPVKRKLRK